MKQYHVTGMSCAACSARVEKAVRAVEGVDFCSVNLLTNSMQVEGTATEEQIVSAVRAAGYGATAKGGRRESRAHEQAEEPNGEIKALWRRLLSSLGFLAVLMYVSMGHMWGAPLPQAMADRPMVLGLIQLLLCITVMVINQRFFISGVRAVLHRSPNMDTLVAMGSAAAFGYSVWMLFRMAVYTQAQDLPMANACLHDLYFESAAMILALITLGKLLEARAKGKTTGALRGLMSLSPATATVVRDGKELEIPLEEVAVGDVFVVRPGGRVPVDGVVTEGMGAIDESALTGESIPVDKGVGARVSAGTVNHSGFLRCRATEVGEDTTLSQIIRLVSDASASKAPIAKIADRVSGIFVPVVMSIAILSTAVWLLVGQTVGFAVARGISVLVISCPCALGLATPVAIMVGSGRAAKCGILFKTATALEQIGKIKTVVLDKTGTVTRGEPTVTDIIPAEGVSEMELLCVAVALEARSEHPLGRAVMSLAEARAISPMPLADFEAVAGYGLRAKNGQELCLGGSERWLRELDIPLGDMPSRAEVLENEGKTPLYFAVDGRLLGVIAVADVLREDSAEAIRQMKRMGLRVVLLTGDKRRTAEAIGKQAGVDEVKAEVLPADKERAVAQLREQGAVAMVGDGINDAPALVRADVGIAIGAGTDVAVDAADVVLVKSRLSDVPTALRIGKATLRVIHQNLFWAFAYNVIGIPLAAGVFISWLGWELAPMFGAAAMSLSSFCVVSNALRLNVLRLYTDPKTNKIKEKKTMTKVMKIEGMMCPHCEARVKKILEGIDGVASAEVSHKKGTATVSLSAPVSDEVLRDAVAAEYTVKEIK